jgi:hypothetical protein
MKKLLFSVILALVVLASNAQERPFRIGVKVGWPQIVGLNLEYVTPLLNERLAGDLDFSYISSSAGDASISLTNFAIGANYYFFDGGRGLYGGLGYNRFGVSAEQDLTENGLTAKGEASGAINLLNLKIGGKHGGLFYFRWELGYGLAISDAKFEATGTAYDSSTGQNVTLKEEVTVPVSGGTPLVNIGFGFSF